MSTRGPLYDAASSAVAALTAAARAFSASATSTTSSAGATIQITQSLDAIVNLTAAAIPAVRAAITTPEGGAIVRACETVLASCQALANAILGRFPVLASYVVPIDAPLIVVVERFYGADAFSRVDEVLANNPNALGLVLIPAGTVLQLAAPTV